LATEHVEFGAINHTHTRTWAVLPRE